MLNDKQRLHLFDIAAYRIINACDVPIGLAVTNFAVSETIALSLCTKVIQLSSFMGNDKRYQ